jgi:hypothetical protein
MLRDFEELSLNTLADLLESTTSLPSGSVFIRKPATEFYNKGEGAHPKDADDNITYPAVSLNYVTDAKFAPNNYGESIYVDNGDGTTTSYTPIGQQELFISISLFTKSSKDQRKIGLEIESTLLENTLVALNNDIIPGEYMGIELQLKKYVDGYMPYQKIFVVKLDGRVLQEITAPTVIDVVTSIATVDEVDVNANVS